jgi:hypothetical protein
MILPSRSITTLAPVFADTEPLVSITVARANGCFASRRASIASSASVTVPDRAAKSRGSLFGFVIAKNRFAVPLERQRCPGTNARTKDGQLRQSEENASPIHCFNAIIGRTASARFGQNSTVTADARQIVGSLVLRVSLMMPTEGMPRRPESMKSFILALSGFEVLHLLKAEYAAARGVEFKVTCEKGFYNRGKFRSYPLWNSSGCGGLSNHVNRDADD